jgi:hypothetical protein
MKPIREPISPITPRQIEAIEELTEKLGEITLLAVKLEFNADHLELTQLSMSHAGLIISELRYFEAQLEKFENRD